MAEHRNVQGIIMPPISVEEWEDAQAEIARLRAEPPIDGDRASKAIDAAFEATYPDQLRRGTLMYHRLRNALIENLAAEPPSAPAPASELGICDKLPGQNHKQNKLCVNFLGTPEGQKEEENGAS